MSNIVSTALRSFWIPGRRVAKAQRVSVERESKNHRTRGVPGPIGTHGVVVVWSLASGPVSTLA